MIKLSPCANAPLFRKGIEVKALYFTKTPGEDFISIYADYNDCRGLVPLHIGLASTPSLQQVRDVDRNISLDSGSYTDAHFYLRSADGNNMSVAYYTNGQGGGIQAGNVSGYAPLNLQPLGGSLTYGGHEVATVNWVQDQGYLNTAPSLQEVATAGNTFTGMLKLGTATLGTGVGGGANTLFGENALNSGINNSGVVYNTAFGSNALAAFQSGNNNTALGEGTLQNLVAGNNNTAVGDWTMFGPTGGGNNTALGVNAGCIVNVNAGFPRGNYNLFLGAGAGGYNGQAPGGNPANTAVGDNNIFIGHSTGYNVTTSNNIYIGNADSAGNSLIMGYMGNSSDQPTLLINSTLSVRDMPAGSNGNALVSWNATTKRFEVLAISSVVSANAPLNYNSTTGTLSISQAGSGTNGYLSSTDWNTFNNKQNALGYTPENIINKSKDSTLGTSDSLYPTQNAVKVYVDKAISSNIAKYVPLTQKGVANGVATLGADGKIPSTQIPALAITNTYTVTSEADMLALSAADVGDIAVRTDISKTFILQTAPASTLANWIQLQSPTVSNTDQVSEGSVNLYFTADRVHNALSVTAPLTYNISNGTFGISKAGAGSDGYITSSDWSAFNAKEPGFAKNTAFNKNFGTTAGTVAEGNDARINNGQTAFSWGNHAGLYPSLSGSYNDPSWIAGLSLNKITNVGASGQIPVSDGSSLVMSNPVWQWSHGVSNYNTLPRNSIFYAYGGEPNSPDASTNFMVMSYGIETGEYPSAQLAMSSYNYDDGFYYRRNYEGNLGGAWYRVASREWTNGNLIQNQYGAAQAANSWISGSSKANHFVLGANGTIFQDNATGYIGFTTEESLAVAANVKMGSLVVSPAYSSTAPANGIYSRGGLQLDLAANDYVSGVSYYSSAYTAWQTYMASPLNGKGIGGNLNPQAGAIVTSWALRNFIENDNGYGWIWESGIFNETSPAVIAELSSTTGNFRTIGSLRSDALHPAGIFAASGLAAGFTYQLSADVNGVIKNTNIRGAQISDNVTLSSTGWVTIAVNGSGAVSPTTGNRASGLFTICHGTSGSHQTLKFQAAYSYGTGWSINVLESSSYWATPAFGAIRMLGNGTYDGAELQVEMLTVPATFYVILEQNYHLDGWSLLETPTQAQQLPGLVPALSIDVPLYINQAAGLVSSSAVSSYDWFRSKKSGLGWYNEVTAAGIYSDTAHEVRTYNNNTLRVGAVGGTGSTVINPGDGTHAGYYSIHNPDGSRNGYIGWITGVMSYQAEQGHHLFTNAGGLPVVEIRPDVSVADPTLLVGNANVAGAYTIQLVNSTGSFQTWIAGTAGQFLTDAQAGDSGFRIKDPNSFRIGGTTTPNNSWFQLNMNKAQFNVPIIPAYTVPAANTGNWQILVKDISTSQMMTIDSSWIAGASDQWTDNTGYNYIGANSPGYGAGDGLYTNGGFAAEECTYINNNSYSVDVRDYFIACVDDCDIELPDPGSYEGRILLLKAVSSDKKPKKVTFAGSYMPQNYTTTIGVLNSAATSQFITIQAAKNLSGSLVWEVVSLSQF